jgi:nicotinamide mononucleotide adenylyltransferase
MGLSSVPWLVMSLLSVGSVHGRFQPFHNEHLEYVIAAKQRCEFLWIGITKYDITPSEFTPLGRPRERPENNPLTYYERVNMIMDAMVGAGVDRASFGFVPFPIETPHRLPEFMPVSVPCFTTVCEEWNREKIKILRSYGYDVIVLWERTEKLVTGGAIREDIMSGGSAWREMVPPQTLLAIEALNLRQRLLGLQSLAPYEGLGRISTDPKNPT